jgi:hypothetical protein
MRAERSGRSAPARQLAFHAVSYSVLYSVLRLHQSNLTAGNVQDSAEINLPVDSQTLYTRIARKTIVDGAAEMNADI